MRLLVFVLLLVLPGLALAEGVDGAGLSVTAPPWHGDCEYNAPVTDGGHDVNLVAGFEDAMQDGRSHPDLERALELFAEQGLVGSRAEARRLLRGARRR